MCKFCSRWRWWSRNWIDSSKETPEAQGSSTRIVHGININIIHQFCGFQSFLQDIIESQASN
jgi:hypothetical protein